MRFKIRGKQEKLEQEKPTQVVAALKDDKVKIEVEDKEPDADSLLHMILLSNTGPDAPLSNAPSTFTDFSFGQYDESTSSNLKILSNMDMFNL